MTVSAVVVSHGHAGELERSLPLLLPQVDELVVVANVGAAATSGDYVLVANPDAVPEPDAVRILREFLDTHPRAGVAGPQMRYFDGSWQASRRSFPTIGATLVRRTPLRLLFPPLRHQRGHYLLDDRPAELLLRRAMLDEIGGWDGGFRMYCEDIDLNYRAAKAGWERWYVPAAVVRHDYAAVIDKTFLSRHTIWHAKAMFRFLRKHPERLLAWR